MPHKSYPCCPPCWASKGPLHCGNPAAALRVEKLYGIPVLLSGLAALVLSKTEEDSLNPHYKTSLERLQRLYRSTPSPVVHYLAGSLPASALLRLRQLSLLGMISRLGPKSILYTVAHQILSSQENYKVSWFLKIKDICQQYALPDPLSILASPPSANSFQNTAKQKVLDYWNLKFRAAVSGLDSLSMFRAEFMSLCNPHPIWTSAGSSPFEIKKATIQARMLSGRYRTCWLRRYWSGDPTGHCRVPGCSQQPGTLQHIATGECPGLSAAAEKANAIWDSFLAHNPILTPIVQQYRNSSNFLSFLLDPTTKCEVIALNQTQGKNESILEKLCYMTRTWLYCMYSKRLRLLDLQK